MNFHGRCREQGAFMKKKNMSKNKSAKKRAEEIRKKEKTEKILKISLFAANIAVYLLVFLFALLKLVNVWDAGLHVAIPLMVCALLLQGARDIVRSRAVGFFCFGAAAAVLVFYLIVVFA